MKILDANYILRYLLEDIPDIINAMSMKSLLLIKKCLNDYHNNTKRNIWRY